jgi:hypothetical protein
MTTDKEMYNVGCCMKLKLMPLGSVVHNIEMYPGRGGNLFDLLAFLRNFWLAVTDMSHLKCHPVKFVSSMKTAAPHLALSLMLSESFELKEKQEETAGKEFDLQSAEQR